jgi:nicotinamidase-related amidase
VDLHGEPSPEERAGLDDACFAAALEKCRDALDSARRLRIPVAFVRRTAAPASLFSPQSYPSWIGGFRPQRSDMIFERVMPSCYASLEFSDMVRRHGEVVLAGVFGETSCLATLIEAYGRAEPFTYLADASVSRGRNGISAAGMHRGVVEIASFYSNVSSTDAWIERVSRRTAIAG